MKKLNDIISTCHVTAYGFEAFKGLAERSNPNGIPVVISTLSAAVMADMGICDYYAPYIRRDTVYNTTEDIVVANLNAKRIQVELVDDITAADPVVIVSRHAGTVDLLREMYPKNIVLESIEVEDILYKNVVGTLPSHLIWYAKRFKGFVIRDFDYNTDGDLAGDKLRDRLVITSTIRIKKEWELSKDEPLPYFEYIFTKDEVKSFCHKYTKEYSENDLGIKYIVEGTFCGWDCDYEMEIKKTDIVHRLTGDKVRECKLCWGARCDRKVPYGTIFEFSHFRFDSESMFKIYELNIGDEYKYFVDCSIELNHHSRTEYFNNQNDMLSFFKEEYGIISYGEVEEIIKEESRRFIEIQKKRGNPTLLIIGRPKFSYSIGYDFGTSYKLGLEFKLVTPFYNGEAGLEESYFHDPSIILRY
ncbi:MAG: hypothetical protein MSA90_21910 [Faecalicatena sp.]|uniref:hypothetical protein n=1 Tax=Faecalicatena sp. TaxID=2005360 RepID=UPI0025872597|nr:hypothetical protein [Faecalicatena sp.]MCI6468106.1 hypothetical protein [Faecalicatena sp.]MDY4670924.1 hypothetical protein [Oliverpabstia sp.]MDY5620359.1 hypothetical protein [Lachnospiraceae bacterium]